MNCSKFSISLSAGTQIPQAVPPDIQKSNARQS